MSQIEIKGLDWGLETRRDPPETPLGALQDGDAVWIPGVGRWSKRFGFGIFEEGVLASPKVVVIIDGYAFVDSSATVKAAQLCPGVYVY